MSTAYADRAAHVMAATAAEREGRTVTAWRHRLAYWGALADDHYARSDRENERYARAAARRYGTALSAIEQGCTVEQARAYLRG